MTSRKNKVIGKEKRKDGIFKMQTKKTREISEWREKKRAEQGTERRVEQKRRKDKIGSTKGNRKEKEKKKVTDWKETEKKGNYSEKREQEGKQTKI